MKSPIDPLVHSDFTYIYIHIQPLQFTGLQQRLLHSLHSGVCEYRCAMQKYVTAQAIPV